MPRFFLNLVNRVGVVPDEEGQELPDLEAARRNAVEAIRWILGEEARAGVIDLRGWIEIADERRKVVEVIPFASAVELHVADPEP